MDYLRYVKDRTLIIADKNNSEIFSVLEESDADKITLFLKGKILSELFYEFEDEVTAAVTAFKNIHIDFSGLEFMAGKGLPLLLEIQNTADSAERNLNLSGLRGEVRKLFDDNHYTEFFRISEDERGE